MDMARHLTRFGIIVLLLLPLCGAGADPIAGEWVSAERTKGALGAARTYSTDGKVQFVFGAIIDFKYEVDGNQLTLSLPQVPEEKGIVHTFTIENDTLILTDGTGNKQVLTRIAGTGNSGLIGKWTGDHYTGAKQLYHFTEAKNCYFSVPMISADGTYTLMGGSTGGILSESYKDKGTQRYKWNIQDGLLMLDNNQGKIEKYIQKK